MARKKKEPEAVAEAEGSTIEPTELLSILYDRQIDPVSRSISLIGEINEDAYAEIDAAIGFLQTCGTGPVTLRIFSPGGNVDSALGILGRIKASGLEVHTEGYGQIKSAAVLLLAGGDKRRISKYCWVMHHAASYGCMGKHGDNKAFVKQLDREERKWSEWMAAFTKKPARFWLTEGAEKDAYFSPEQALELGIIDEII